MIKKLSEIDGEECTCKGSSKHIGDVIGKDGKLLYRFDINCPIHGVFDVTDEPPLDADDKDC